MRDTVDSAPWQLASFAEAGGEDDGIGYAGRAAIAYGRRYARRRHGDHRQIHRLLDRRGGREARASVQFLILRVDQMHGTGEARILQRLDRLAADTRQIPGRADDGDGARTEEALEFHGRFLNLVLGAKAHSQPRARRSNLAGRHRITNPRRPGAAAAGWR